MPTAPDAQRDWKFDLSLSGGGVRASFFALGVILYLIDADLRGRIASISSVSGGSITNAALATGADIATAPKDEIRNRLQRFARLLARDGSFFWVGLKRIIKVMLTFGLAGILVLIIGASFTPSRPPIWVQVMALTVELVALILASWSRRRRTQIAIYERFLKRLEYPDESGRKKPLRRAKENASRVLLKNLPDTSTVHIFCSTELTSGAPMFMTKTWSYCPAYGCALLENISVAEAVYASAAFPLVFPPLPVNVDPVEWSGGDLLERPTVLRLADGGVYNNLGTDWRETITTASDVFQGLTKRFEYPVAAERRLIVNASAPGRVDDLRGFSLIRGAREFARTITIMYENTVRPRLQQLAQDPAYGENLVIDVSHAPLSVAEDIANRAIDKEARDRASAVAKILKSRPYGYWEEYNYKAARVRTTLESVGPKQAAQLLQHGYLNAAVICHSVFNSPGLEIVPNDRWFYHYAIADSFADVEAFAID